MSITVNKQVFITSAMPQSCVLVLSDKRTKIQAVYYDREASINQNQKPKFIVDFNVIRTARFYGTTLFICQFII